MPDVLSFLNYNSVRMVLSEHHQCFFKIFTVYVVSMWYESITWHKNIYTQSEPLSIHSSTHPYNWIIMTIIIIFNSIGGPWTLMSTFLSTWAHGFHLQVSEHEDRTQLWRWQCWVRSKLILFGNVMKIEIGGRTQACLLVQSRVTQGTVLSSMC